MLRKLAFCCRITVLITQSRTLLPELKERWQLAKIIARWRMGCHCTQLTLKLLPQHKNWKRACTPIRPLVRNWRGRLSPGFPFFHCGAYLACVVHYFQTTILSLSSSSSASSSFWAPPSPPEFSSSSFWGEDSSLRSRASGNNTQFSPEEGGASWSGGEEHENGEEKHKNERHTSDCVFRNLWCFIHIISAWIFLWNWCKQIFFYANLWKTMKQMLIFYDVSPRFAFRQSPPVLFPPPVFTCPPSPGGVTSCDQPVWQISLCRGFSNEVWEKFATTANFTTFIS